MGFDPSYWKREWKFTPIEQRMEKDGKNGPPDSWAVATDSLDYSHYEFNLYPRKIRPYSGSELPSYHWIIVNRDWEERGKLEKILGQKGWRVDFEYEEKSGKQGYQIWRRISDSTEGGKE